MNITKFVICILTIIVYSVTNAQDANKILEKRIFTTQEVDAKDAPVIDGVMNFEEWSKVDWADNFTQRIPNEGDKPSQDTKFKVLYDAKNIYIGIRSFDTQPDSIVKRLGRRDSFQGDWVEVNIDSYHDLRTGFSFTITSAGVKGDEFISNNGNNWDSSWNPIWYTKVSHDDKGWTAEMKIPLTQLRFGKGEEQLWGFQVQRYFFRKNERSFWQHMPQKINGWVSNFGELHGLKNIEPQKQIEIQPYTVARFETFEEVAKNPFEDGRDAKISVGLDGKIGVTNDLTLDFTINPDFGQVEADPAAIALDGFQLFFREQRPFFVENKNIFDYRFSRTNSGNTFGNDNLFYSRRIGRSPQHASDLNDDEFAEAPENTTILGAAKFSGKTKNGWSIGVLESITAKETAEIDNLGERRKETVEPFTNYFVGRLQKDFNDRNTFVGGIFTATNRNLEEHLEFLHKAAYTGGFDFKHQWKERSWYLQGNMVLSHVEGSKEAILETQESIVHLFQRTDNEHLEVDPDRTSLTGTGGRLQLGKGSGNFIFEGGFTWRSPELELNDIGFQRQADDFRHNFWMGYRWRKPFGIFRNIGVNYNHFSAWDFEGNHNRIEWNINGFAQLKSNWRFNTGFQIKPKLFSNTALRGGPRFKNSDEFSNWININTDNRKKVQFNFNSFMSFGQENTWSNYELNLGATYRPLDAMSISINPGYSRNINKVQYVDQLDFGSSKRYITGNIDQQTLSASIRLNYTLNPNLTIQYYAQPFISSGRYNRFNYVNNPIAKKLAGRITEFSESQIAFDALDEVYNIDENKDGTTDYSFDKPDFSFVQFRSNLVVRWEYIPGSEIFLVWSQGVTGNDDSTNNLLRNLDNQILQKQIENIFLIKATYRFVL
ncbi:DUF5916 domain-containing protein [Thalassobellus sediminis]|uniref:DUF5916 domain-containing protein n=1 Tax=Thalassobellus sediminis TaxID=3367753 RepID=UPI0037B6B27A